MHLQWTKRSDEEICESRQNRRRILLYILLLIAISISISIAYSHSPWAIPAAAKSLIPGSGQTKTMEHWEDCGGTPEEAHHRNCHFDILSMAWQTHECFDHATASAFLAHHEYFNTSDVHSYHAPHEGQSQQQEDKDIVTTAWKFFLDEEGQHEVPLSVVQSGEQTIYVTQEYHYTHCTYMWRQMHRAYAELGYIDSHLANWRHTLHCQKVLLAGMGDKNPIGAVGKVLYPKCIKVGDVSGEQGLIQADPY